MLKNSHTVKHITKEIPTETNALSGLQHELGLQLPTPEQALPVAWGAKNHIQVFIKRDDMMHAVISGNKWRKLQHTLLFARKNHIQHIMSFGGGHSNHLHALAFCCHQLNIKLTAFIRGNYSQRTTPTLHNLSQWGTTIHYVTKADYQKRYDEQYIATLQQTHSELQNALVIPEGGSDQKALKGVAGLLEELQQRYDYICCPVGSGGTLAGLAYGLSGQLTNGNPEKPHRGGIKHNQTTLLGFAMLKGEGHLEALVNNLLPPDVPAPHIIHQFHGGGFAKKPGWLISFCQEFTQETGIAVEPVYSGKLCHAVKSLIEADYFPPHSRILMLHTGGLQGNRISSG